MLDTVTIVTTTYFKVDLTMLFLYGGVSCTAFVGVSILLALISIAIGLSPPAAMFVTGMDRDKVPLLKQAFVAMAWFPGVDGLRYFLQGALSRQRLSSSQAIGVRSYYMCFVCYLLSPTCFSSAPPTYVVVVVVVVVSSSFWSRK